MKRVLFLIFLLIIITPNIYAECSYNQININSASKTELDKLYGIGETKAKAIINSRPFDSVDDLIKVYGIGEITLEKIKEQGLACVQDEKDNKSDEIERDENIVINEENNLINNTKTETQKEIQLIKLTTKDIKSDNNSKNKTDYIIYPFIGFCVLLVVLYLIRYSKKNGIR